MLSLSGRCVLCVSEVPYLCVGCVLGRGVIPPQTRYLIEGLILALQAWGTYLSLVGVSWPPWYTLKEGVFSVAPWEGVYSPWAPWYLISLSQVPYLSLGCVLGKAHSWVRLILGVRLIPQDPG